MNIFVILAALLAVAVIGVSVALLVGLVVILIIAWVKRSRKLALWSSAGVLGSIMALAGLYCGTVHLFFGPYDPKSADALKEAYKADFGSLPPTGITVLKARQIVIGDSGRQWLLLKATPEEIERHVAMGFTKPHVTPDDFEGKAGANAPRWWKPPTERLEIYENRDWSKNGGWFRSEAAIGVDRTSNLIWFAASKSS